MAMPRKRQRNIESNQEAMLYEFLRNEAVESEYKKLMTDYEHYFRDSKLCYCCKRTWDAIYARG